MLTGDELRLALEDARAQHSAVVELIYQTDRQAMSLLSHYVIVGIAAISGAVASLGSVAFLPPAAGAGLFAAAVALFIGAIFCFRTMESGTIALPGREAEFWKWAMLPGVTMEDAARAYLDNLIKVATNNDDMNKRAAIKFKRAKWWGVASTPLAAAVGFFAWLLSG